MAAEPGVGFRDIAFVELREQRVECRAVVEVDEVRDFVRDHRAADVIGSLDQPPV